MYKHKCLNFRRTEISPTKSIVFFVDFHYLHFPRGYIISTGSRKSSPDIPHQHLAIWQLCDHMVPDELHKTQLPEPNQFSDTAPPDRTGLDETKYLVTKLLDGCMMCSVFADLVLTGVNSVLADHPEAFIYPVFIATLKSSGFMVVKYLEQKLMHGLNKPFKVTSHYTKTMVLAACVLVAQSRGLVTMDQGELYTVMVMLLMVIRIADTMGILRVSCFLE